jgi:prolyl 4-hydroxylase
MKASDVVNTDTGVFEASETRTSTGTFLEAGQDEVVRRIEKRVAQVTMTPVGAEVGGLWGVASSAGSVL